MTVFTLIAFLLILTPGLIIIFLFDPEALFYVGLTLIFSLSFFFIFMIH